MATWPHVETPLTNEEKEAYRFLLYQAMLDIRNLCQSRGRPTYNPFLWWQQYQRSRLAGALADWLHNLAFYSSVDFKGFDADWFWEEYSGFCGRFSVTYYIVDYRNHFDRHLGCLRR